MNNTWSSEGYREHAPYVPSLGAAVLDLLAPQPGERILDIGCGDGTLTQQIVERGATVVGIDSSPQMIDAARARGLDVRLLNAEALPFNQEFDAVFSNAALHWIRDHDALLDGVARALRPGGRFVVELWVPELRSLPPGSRATVWAVEPGYLGIDTYDVLHQQVVSHHVRFGEGTDARLGRSPHRYVWPAELDLMAQLAGLELESRHADWAGEQFTADSRSHVSVYRTA